MKSRLAMRWWVRFARWCDARFGSPVITVVQHVALQKYQDKIAIARVFRESGARADALQTEEDAERIIEWLETHGVMPGHPQPECQATLAAARKAFLLWCQVVMEAEPGPDRVDAVAKARECYKMWRAVAAEAVADILAYTASEIA